MPKRVDHRERRAQIADALMRVAAERGLEAVSLRHVAAEAGVSAGMVQHYFASKDEMMVFALDRVSERVAARLDAGDDFSLRAFLLQLLPLDAERTVEAQIALAFMAYTAVRPAVGAGERAQTAQLRTFLAGLLPAAPLAPELAATALLALTDGLAVHLLRGHCTGEEAVAVLDAQLAAWSG